MRIMIAAAVATVTAAPALAAPTNLSGWTAEGPGGTWVRAVDNNSVRQTVNGDPTVFYSDFNAIGRRLSGTISVSSSGGDDDFIGFVVGFNPGDLASATGDFLLIDWKGGTQGAFGCSANAGVAVSQVTAGLSNNSGAWCHQDNGVTELARGTTLGASRWAFDTSYTFDIEFTSTNLKLFVDGVQQADLTGSFSDGRFGFYNYSQAQVTYAGITDSVLPPVDPGAVPEPATWAMMIGGFGLVGGAMRRRSGPLRAAA